VNKVLIGLILALTIPMTAFAEPEMMDGMAQKRTEHMTKMLSLTDEQKPKVEAILKTEMEKMKAVHEETKNSLKEVLTPEQMTKFETMHEKHQQMRKERMTDKKSKP
jgi:periplasmic protein CpxP/Spy